MTRIQLFTSTQRAWTVAGLAPAILLGCGVHAYYPTASAAQPSPQPAVALPVPDAELPPAKAPPPELAQSIQALTHNFSGIVGVSVRSLDEGWQVSSNGDRKLPQQSVSKLWVAMTVLDQIDQGKLSLDTPLVITKEDFTLFHQPIASLVHGDQGYNSTVGEIMKRALTMSDNTCNDKLLRLVGGPPAVRAFIESKGLGSIRFGPGEKLLQSRTAGLEWRPEFAMGNAFAQARARLPQSVRQAAFESYVADPPDGAAPNAIANALAKLQSGRLLSPTSTDWLIGTMEKSHTGKQRMHGAVPAGWEFGHKTGTGQDLGAKIAGYNDVGFLKAPDGKTYTLAVMIGETTRPIPARQELMQSIVQAVIRNHKGEPSTASLTPPSGTSAAVDPAWKAFH